MSWTHRCDVCGEDIESWRSYVTLKLDDGWLGHYHEGRCWDRIHDAIKLLHDVGPTIDALPTASHAAVRAARKKHARPAGEGDHSVNVAELYYLSARTYNALTRAEIYTLADLRARIAACELTAVPGIGKKALDEVERSLDRLADETRRSTNAKKGQR